MHSEEKLGPAAIARRLGIGRASVYRVLGTKKPMVARLDMVEEGRNDDRELG